MREATKRGYIMADYPLIDIKKLTPYKNNAREHSQEQIESIARSIKEFGFITPVIIDENNMILVGHGRTKAAAFAGLEKIPYRRVTSLSDEQKRAYILVDNKLSDIAEWNEELLNTELENITLDMGAFGFDFEPLEELTVSEIDEGYYGDERERTTNAYNIDILDFDNITKDFWQMPIIRNDDYIPSDLVSFNYAKTYKDKNVGIHFFIDDYQFERVWNYPSKYIDILYEYDCILTPDFSLYLEMPMPMKIWNIYRSRQIGAYYQSKGITVIPTISWAEKETFSFCFKGIEQGSVVAVSTIGVKENEKAYNIWRDGMDEMIKQIKPSVILVYGGKVKYNYGKIKVVYFDNKNTERIKKSNEKNET